jgi:DMSO reductase anchor subunit
LHRTLAAGTGAVALVGALFHLGRPAIAHKALRNIRRSWLSREVALLFAFAAAAAGAVVVPALDPLAAVAGVAGLYASARLYIVPGRPAWNSHLTVVRFAATALALGPLLTGHERVAVVGMVLALLATVANWLRLAPRHSVATRGALLLELRWLRGWTMLRFASMVAAVALVPIESPVALAIAGASELTGRWLFYVAVVPLNMPGAFWRGTAGTHR